MFCLSRFKIGQGFTDSTLLVNLIKLKTNLRPRNITLTPGGPETTVTKVLETDQVKRGTSKGNYVIS